MEGDDKEEVGGEGVDEALGAATGDGAGVVANEDEALREGRPQPGRRQGGWEGSGHVAGSCGNVRILGERDNLTTPIAIPLTTPIAIPLTP